MMRSFLPALLFFLLGVALQAQHINEHLCVKTTLDSADNKKLFLGIENTDFVKNNEYFNDICEGYTLIGFGLSPTISYYFTPKFKAEAGFYLLMYFGSDKYALFTPTIRLQYQINKHFDLVFGRLFGTVNHRLLDPLYGFDRFYTDPVETGVQFLIDYPFLWGDFWIDWQRFIMPRDTFPEEFSAGYSNQINFLKPDCPWQISVPFQGIIYHKGGQISDYQESLTTILNTAEGITVGRKFRSKFLNSLYLDNYLVTYNELGKPQLPFHNGMGYYASLTAGSKFGSLQVGYWNADKFYAPLGEPLYQSVSRLTDGFTIFHREMILGKAVFNYQIDQGIWLDIRFEGYFYPGDNHFDYAYGLTFTINKDFFLKKFMPRADKQ